MTPSQLRTFIAVVQHRSVSRAADALFVSQAAVSSVLSSLQAELGVALIARDGRNIMITEAGQVLFERATEIVGLLGDAARATREAGQKARLTLRVGAVTTVAEFLLPAWIRSFLAAEREFDVALEVGNRERVFDLLASRQVDIVIAGRPSNPGAFTSVATRAHSLVLIGSAMNGMETDPTSATWLLREEGSGSRLSALEVIAATGLEVPTMTIGSNVAILQAVNLGLGIALVSSDSMIGQSFNLDVREIPLPTLPVAKQWHLAVRRGNETQPAIQAFISHLARSSEISISS